MAERHELGFLRFVGRGLRYVAVLGTLWVGLAGWQAGALKRCPRDRFIGWKAPQQYEWLHLVASNTRLLVLPGLPESGQLVCRRDAPPPE